MDRFQPEKYKELLHCIEVVSERPACLRRFITEEHFITEIPSASCMSHSSSSLEELVASNSDIDKYDMVLWYCESQDAELRHGVHHGKPGVFVQRTWVVSALPERTMFVSKELNMNHDKIKNGVEPESWWTIETKRGCGTTWVSGDKVVGIGPKRE